MHQPISSHLPEREIPYRAARFQGGPRQHSIDGIVIHSAEMPRRKGSAALLAGLFAQGIRGGGGQIIKSSAHFSVDSEEVWQSVPEDHIAFHARCGWEKHYPQGRANSSWIGIEFIGKYHYSKEDWLADGGGQIELGAQLIASLCRKHEIPAMRLTGQDFLIGFQGIVGHDTVTRAYPVRGGHVDPGPGFPWAELMDRVLAWR